MSVTVTLHPIIARLLRPIAKLCLKRGIHIQELIEAVKAACISVATEELKEQNQEVNISRLSVLTGIQRKEIKRLEQDPENARGSANLLARVLGAWQADPKFIDNNGRPRLLDAEGAESEFADLVKSVSADVNPYTILFGLEQVGAVKREGKVLRLDAPVFDAAQDTTQGMELLAQDSEALFQSVTSNLEKRTPTPNLHLTTEYDNICVENLPEIREWLLDRGTTFHEEVRAYVAKFDKDLNPRLHKKEGGGQVRVTAFSTVCSGKKS